MWRVEQQNKNAEEIADRAGKLYDKFVSFVADLELIGSRLESTQSAYQDAYNKLASGRGNLVKRAEDMKALGVKVSKSLPRNLVEMPEREVPRSISSVDSQETRS
jgi:DNA recombination protein RmuC